MSLSHADGVDIALLGAVRQEIELLLPVLEGLRSFDFRGETLHMGTFNQLSVLIGTTGLGKVNAAITTAAVLETFGASEVWNVGCAGAYEEASLGVGDVVISDTILCGDEGVLSRKGILSVREIGIPLVVREGRSVFDRFPLARDSSIYDRARQSVPAGWYRVDQGRLLRNGALDEPLAPGRKEKADSFRITHGPSLTVSLVSGDGKTARKRYERYRAMVESMEGSAIAQTCFRYEVPFLECRSISNMAGDRNKARWKLDLAASRCCAVIRHWMDGLTWTLSTDSQWHRPVSKGT
jgi:futalosine hydrolase